MPLLRAAQHSKHLVQLRAIVDAVAEFAPDAAASARLGESSRLLADLQRAAPEVTAQLLAHPQVGAWAAWCLRRVRGAVTDDVALAVDLAHLGAIVAAAAVRAGHEVEVLVPVRSGTVSLPSLGRAVFGGGRRWPLVMAVCSAGRLRISRSSAAVPIGAGHPAWQPLRRLSETASGIRIEVELDDLDPYRGGYGFTAAGRLDRTGFQHWVNLFGQAWVILAQRHAARAATIASGVVSIVPLDGGQGFTGVSSSSRDANGAVALTLPAGGPDFAVSLVHEAEHSKLNAVHDLTPLYEPGRTEFYYSPWREDPRPVFGLLHGTYAFLGVADFWDTERRHGGWPAADHEFARIRHQLRIGHAQLAAANGLTAAGRQVAAAMGEVIEGLCATALPAAVVRRAEDLAAEHLRRWRRQHAQPARQQV